MAQVRRLAPQASGVLIRRPLLDAAFPDSSDVDLLAFDEIDDLYPQRLPVVVDGYRRSADITWLPAHWIENPREMAGRGLIAHRLMTSEPLFFASSTLEQRVREVETAFRSVEATTQRIGGFFQMASLTVREVGITWDFPSLAMFWLHMAYGACLAAAVDGRGHACPNIYTQPLGYLDALGQEGARFAPEWIARLRLDVEPGTVAAATARIYERVAARCAEPIWPADMRATTRCEYRYWLAREERDYRLAVAAEMTRRGSPEAAVHYLRFYAYALARIPLVHARAAEGRNVSFLRPEQAVLPDLTRHCPDIIDDLTFVFSGRQPATDVDVREALATLSDFRDRTVADLRSSHIELPALGPWKPLERVTQQGDGESCRT